MNLSNKVALVTGATSGIGEGIAKRLAEDGADVAVAGRNKERGGRVVREIVGNNHKALFVQMDISDSKQVQAGIAQTVRTYGGLDILVNNAGDNTGMSGGIISEVSEEVWDKSIDVDLKGAFLCSKYTIPEMEKRHGGSIVNISSVLGFYGYPGSSPYCAAKGGLIMLTKATAVDCAQFAIRANCICPGAIETPAFGILYPDSTKLERRLNLYRKWYPVGRIGRPEDIAPLASYLAGDESSFVTGSIFMVDGGMHAQSPEVILNKVFAETL